MNTEQLATTRALDAQLRVDSIRCSTAAGSGHPTSSLSAADLMAVLLDDLLASTEPLAAIAESFERIHRSNLIGMGVLPLQFRLGDPAETLGLTGPCRASTDGPSREQRRA